MSAIIMYPLKMARVAYKDDTRNVLRLICDRNENRNRKTRTYQGTHTRSRYQTVNNPETHVRITSQRYKWLNMDSEHTRDLIRCQGRVGIPLYRSHPFTQWQWKNMLENG
jgi:hypothetical protein